MTALIRLLGPLLLAALLALAAVPPAIHFVEIIGAQQATYARLLDN